MYNVEWRMSSVIKNLETIYGMSEKLIRFVVSRWDFEVGCGYVVFFD